MADKYNYIGPLVWQKDEGGSEYWRAPDNTIGWFDLRGADQECGFFCTSKPILDSSYTLLGEGDLGEYHTTQIQRDALRSILSLEIEEIPDSDTLLSNIIIKILEECGDVEGGKRFTGLIPTSKGYFEIYLGGQLISNRKFQGESDITWPRIQATIHQRYQELYNAEEMVRMKWLSTLKVKYKIEDERKFQPAGINEKAIKPATTLSHNFDNATNGVSIDGLASGEGWNWSVLAILSGDVEGTGFDVRGISPPNNSGNIAIANQALSSDDHYSQVKFIYSSGSGYRPGVIARKDNSATYTCYRMYFKESVLITYLVRINAGSETILDSAGGNVEGVAGMRISCDGSTIKGYKTETTEILSDTDPSPITGNLYCGVDIGGLGRVDDFEAADLAAVGLSIPVAMHHYRMMRN